MRSFVRLGVYAVPVFLSVGCASLTTSNENQIRVETVDASGVEVKDATCVMLRGSLKSEFKTPAVVPVAKGSNNIVMDCAKQGFEDGKAVVTSRVGAATFGNVLAGGLIGAVVDQATGKAYNYPDWIQIVMGKILGFDRSNHQDGKPTKGLPIDGVVDPSPNPARPALQPAAEPAKAEESKK